MNAPDDQQRTGGIEWQADKRVRESAMVLKAIHRSAKLGEDVEVRDLRGNCHQRSGKRSLAVESGASKTCAEEDVGYRFQKRVSSFSFLVSSVRRQRAMAAQALYRNVIPSGARNLLFQSSTTKDGALQI